MYSVHTCTFIREKILSPYNSLKWKQYFACYCKCKLSWKIAPKNTSLFAKLSKSQSFCQILLGYKLRVAIIVTYLSQVTTVSNPFVTQPIQKMLLKLCLKTLASIVHEHHNSCWHMQCFSGKQKHILVPHTGGWIVLFVILLWKVRVVTTVWLCHIRYTPNIIR